MLDITEVAKRTGLPASTLRFYEEKGLISSIGRKGLHRVFDIGILERLSFISLGRSAGFTLEEIASMFTANGIYNIDRDNLSAKADELDRTIKQLSAIRNSLRHAAKCPASNHLECPTFQRLLKIAGKAQYRQKKRK
jgi:DNA-binding transcriptional MerR regulator